MDEREKGLTVQATQAELRGFRAQERGQSGIAYREFRKADTLWVAAGWLHTGTMCLARALKCRDGF
jgi:hypothetical protein